MNEARIREVGPRDGIRSERDIVPTGVKVQLIDGLAVAGPVDWND